jgi:hypothetical protein
MLVTHHNRDQNQVGAALKCGKDIRRIAGFSRLLRSRSLLRGQNGGGEQKSEERVRL